MIQEFDCVALLDDIPSSGLQSGRVGAVVFVHDNGAAFEVEFVGPSGETIAIETLAAGSLRAARSDDLAGAGKHT